ncbi:MAG: hypothetical protein Tsb0034_03050 [Ekhidna sp.]
MKSTIFSTLLLVFVLCSSGQSLQELYQAGTEAYKEKNYELFRDKMFTIDSLRPNYPVVVYNLAAGYALNGQLDLAINKLVNYTLMDATKDFAADSDFVNVINSDRYSDVTNLQKKLTKEVSVKQAYNLSLQEIHPESITYSKQTKSYYIGGVRDGRIWKYTDNSEPEVFISSPDSSWAVMGLEISTDGKSLWACTSSMNNYSKYTESEAGYASVLQFDLKTGKLLNTFVEKGGHNFGDLIISKKGDIYISDGLANKLYWIKNGSDELKVFVDLSETAFNLQGLTFSKDQKSIYISDYIDGIIKLDLDSRDAKKLKVKHPEVLLKGIDGLYLDNGSLLALHNGTTPNRVMKYKLGTNDDIIEAEIVAQGGILGEPTQGVYVGNKFCFIANSPWAAYDREGNFNPPAEKIILGLID